MSAQVIHVDALTGQITERDFTLEEQTQHDADAAKAALDAATAAAKAEADAAAKEAAVAHAKSLGFTDEMIAGMWPGLGGAL